MGGDKQPRKKQKVDEESVGDSSTQTGPPPLRELLERNNFHYDKLEATNTEVGGEIMKKARKIVKDPRSSAMRDESAQRILELRHEILDTNEATFMDKLWRVLVRVARHKQVKTPSGSANEYQTMVVDWDKDGLDYEKDRIWQADSIPVVDTAKNPEFKRALKALPKIATPKPDIAYGLKRNVFKKEKECDYDEYNVINSKFSRISNGLYHTFFIVEFKGSGNDIYKAEMQACRGGAALVNAMRMFKAGFVKIDNDHLQKVPCMAFSLAVNTTNASLWVHWAQPNDEEIVYNMNMIALYQLREAEGLVKLRHDIDNILDWGTGARVDYLKAMFKKHADAKKPKGA